MCVAHHLVPMRYLLLGCTPIPGAPADFGRMIAYETEKWSKVVKFSGAKVE